MDLIDQPRIQGKRADVHVLGLHLAVAKDALHLRVLVSQRLVEIARVKRLVHPSRVVGVGGRLVVLAFLLLLHPLEDFHRARKADRIRGNAELLVREHGVGVGLAGKRHQLAFVLRVDRVGFDLDHRLAGKQQALFGLHRPVFV